MNKIKLFAGFALGGTIFAGALGSAAALIVDGGTVQSGSDNTLQCDTDGVTVSYVLTGGNDVDKITVSGFAAACNGLTATVGTDDSFPASGTIVAGSVTVDLVPDADAEDITVVTVTVAS